MLSSFPKADVSNFHKLVLWKFFLAIKLLHYKFFYIAFGTGIKFPKKNRGTETEGTGNPSYR